MLELTVLLIGIVILFVAIYFWNKSNNYSILDEGFENYYLTGCPSGYKSFYNTDGNIVCCDGDVLANKCLGDNQCTLNGKGTADMPNCVEAITKMYAEKGKAQCPSTMPQYYEDGTNSMKGCTRGRLNDTLSAPQFSNQPKCTIYNNQRENINSLDSCYNQKQLDGITCFGNNCTKELTQPIAAAPPLVAIGFTDNSGMHRIAYTRSSMETFLDVSNPSWRNQGMDLSKNINVAEVAKAYYIDRTIDKSEIQF
jgi:hypothetical protein